MVVLIPGTTFLHVKALTVSKWGEALRDDTNNDGEGDYYISCVGVNIRHEFVPLM